MTFRPMLENARLGGVTEQGGFSRDTAQRHAFTAIELVGVLTVLSLLGLALIPQVIKRIDHAAWERETSDLNTIADSYIQSSLRNKTIPGTNTWASSVASYMSVPVTGITNTPRGLARAFLIDPNLRVGTNAGSGLPYTQDINGSTNPANARVIFLSSLSRALPVASGSPSATEFNAIWDTPENGKPSTATWTSWAGKG